MKYRKIPVFILCAMLALPAAFPFNGVHAVGNAIEVENAEVVGGESVEEDLVDNKTEDNDSTGTLIEKVTEETSVTESEKIDSSADESESFQEKVSRKIDSKDDSMREISQIPQDMEQEVKDSASVRESVSIPEKISRKIVLKDDSVTVSGRLPQDTELKVERMSDPFDLARKNPGLKQRSTLRGVSSKFEADSTGLDKQIDFADEQDTSEDRATDYDDWNAIAFYDIKLMDSGEVIQPDEDVTVTIENVSIPDSGEIVVKHFLDDEDAIRTALENNKVVEISDDSYANAFPEAAKAAKEVNGKTGTVYVETITKADGLVVEGNSVTFPAKSFSIYAVGEEPAKYRLNVIFHLADSTTVSMLVKEDDINQSDEYFNTVVYDPGPGEIDDATQLFRGWTDEQNYTSETDPMDIDEVRQFIKDKVSRTVSGGLSEDLTETLHLYVMLFNAYTVTYKDETGDVLIKVENMRFNDADPDKSYVINENYTPLSADANFVGWKAVEGADKITAPENELYYPNETTVQLSGNVVLQPYLENGWWITFDENGRGASYTGPQFVKNGEVSHKPTKDPTRLGYTFGGWYTDEACTDGNEYPFELPLTDRLTLYAKWIAVDKANYTIIIWKQKVVGDGYDFEEAISSTDYVDSVIDDVTETGTGNEKHAVVNGTAKTYKGFHLRDFDTNISVVPEGTSVLNVFYDRNIVTLNFYTWGNTTVERYEETTDSYYTTSEQYALVDGEYIRLSYSYSNGGYWYYESDEQGYVATNSNSTNPQQYGLVNGQYVPLTRHGFSYIIGNTYYWTYVSGYNYTASNSNSNSPQKYGYDPASGQYYPLEKNGNTWYMNGQEYTGTRFTRSEVTTEYTGTRYILQDLTVVYTGIRYKKISSRWALYQSYQGRYGSTLAANNKTWPAGYDWYETGNSNGSVGGTMTTFLDAFLPSNGSTSLQSFYGTASDGGNATIHFLQQNPEKTGYVEVHSLHTSGGTFYITDKFSGFTAYQYSTDNVNWYGVGTYNGEHYGNGVSYSSNLYIRFNRDSFKLAFWDGIYVDGNGNPVADSVNRGQLKEVDDIVYGADLTGYNKGGDSYYAPEFNGYVFEGWYLDKNCTQACTFSTMPEGGLSVYAKWRQRQYRVFLHPNIPTDEDFKWADDNQSTSFRVDYNAVISSGKVIDGVRTGYEIVGWYRDAALRQAFNFETHLTEDTVTTDYDKTRASELDKYGEPLGEKRTYTDGKDYVWDPTKNDWYKELNEETGDLEMVRWNKDESRFWVEQSLDLYAKWRKIINGAKGIYVEYDANGGSNAPQDPTPYLDQAPSIARGAPTPPESSTEVFKYWAIMKYVNGQFEDSGEHILPGNEFTVQLDYAKGEEIPQDQQVDGGDTMRYTVMLQAVYGPIETETKTQIVYDGNGGTTERSSSPQDSIVVSDDKTTITYNDLTINANHTTLGAETFTREGYEFNGWALSATATEPSFNERQEVAADNLDLDGNPYTNTLYALWKEKDATIIYQAVGPENASNFGTVRINNSGTEGALSVSETVSAVTGVPKGAIATENENYRFIGWYYDEGCNQFVEQSETFRPVKQESEPWPEVTTYYAKFDYATTTLTISKSGMGAGEGAIFIIKGKGYNDGLIIAVPNDQSVTIANVFVGEIYTVTEQDSWSWRYKQITDEVTIHSDPDKNEVKIENESNNKVKWLSGAAFAVNKKSPESSGSD